MSDNPNFVAIGYAYGINARRLRADAVSGIETPAETGELLERFLKSRHPELLVFECPPEANVYPMVPSGAALSEMLLEEE